MSDLIRQLVYIIRKMPSKRYMAYMRSRQWQKVRNEHLQSVDGWCEVCRKAKACQVHHMSYARLGFENAQDLCAVCVQCHHEIHCAVMPIAANDNDQLALPFEASG